MMLSLLDKRCITCLLPAIEDQCRDCLTGEPINETLRAVRARYLKT